MTLPDIAPSIWAYKSIPFSEALRPGYWDGATQLKEGDLLIISGRKTRPFCLRVTACKGERVDVEEARTVAGDETRSPLAQQYKMTIDSLNKQIALSIGTESREVVEALNDQLLLTYAKWVDLLEAREGADIEQQLKGAYAELIESLISSGKLDFKRWLREVRRWTI